MLPLEFTVSGIPISAQASTNKRRHWRAQVTTAAQTAAGGPPAVCRLHVEIVHYFRDGQIDLDNLAKPFLDSLKGIVYLDDGQIDSLWLIRTNLEMPLVMQNVNPIVLRELVKGSDFIYASVRELNADAGDRL
jgi:Holliday junction resolvase RusA-like endonuclease